MSATRLHGRGQVTGPVPLSLQESWCRYWSGIFYFTTGMSLVSYIENCIHCAELLNDKSAN